MLYSKWYKYRSPHVYRYVRACVCVRVCVCVWRFVWQTGVVQGGGGAELEITEFFLFVGQK